MSEQRRSHWDGVYGSKSPTEVSWYQPRPVLSLELIRSCQIDSTAGIIDVGGSTIVATLALDGPKRCSGLDVVRYRPESLGTELGQQFELIESRPEIHQTPSGGEQKFVYCRFHRTD